ncbi:MAG: aminopeptidase [Thermoleophilia bacterium]|nr:aminopeptidase [Thermoleophilia bacterium]MCZ4496974.1 aminopeptidase [Thermoleophilia bacterium]
MRLAVVAQASVRPIVVPSSAGLRLAAAPSSDESLLIERMQASKTLTHIDVLNRTPRTWKTPGYDQAVDYVVQQMRDAGWDVRVEELEAKSWSGTGKLRNVVAERRGTAADGERKLVVAGAHLDSVRNGPGANDNASGSSTLIELAKSFEGIDTRNDVRLVWFDGEEAGLLGSIAHVKANAADSDRTIAMLNMDMVGSYAGRVGFDLGRRTGTAGLSDAMKGVQLRTGLTAVEYPERHSRSDHASFDNVGIPSIDFGVSVKSVEKDDPYYHSPKDTVDKINPDVLEGYGDLIAVTLLDFANRSSRIG